MKSLQQMAPFPRFCRRRPETRAPSWWGPARVIPWAHTHVVREDRLSGVSSSQSSTPTAMPVLRTHLTCRPKVWTAGPSLWVRPSAWALGSTIPLCPHAPRWEESCGEGHVIHSQHGNHGQHLDLFPKLFWCLQAAAIPHL